MRKENFKLLVVIIFVMVTLYSLHKISFAVLNIPTNSFRYSLEHLYLFFGIFSTAILIILIKVRQKNLDIVGNTFLLLTTAKMIFCYVFGNSVINQTAEKGGTEKWNFFALFMLFLLLETIVTIVLLNKKN